MPEYWSKLALYIHSHGDEWDWNPELFYNTTKYLVKKIKEHHVNEGDTDAVELIEIFGEDLLLAHVKVDLLMTNRLNTLLQLNMSIVTYV